MGTFTIDRRALTRRAVIGAIGAGLAFATTARAAPVKAPRVLFVCQFGSVKSPLARELLRRRARERGVAVFAFSRGITPQPHLPRELATRWLAEGLDPARDGLHRLLPIDAGYADVVAVFDPLPGDFAATRVLDWTGVPSMLRDYPAARADLDGRIEALLDTLAA